MRSKLLPAILFPLLVLAVLLGGRDATALNKDLRSIKQSLARAVARSDVDKLSELIGQLSMMDEPKAVPYLVQAAAAVASADNHELAVQAIGSFASKETVKALVRLLQAPAKSRKKQRGDPEQIRRAQVVILDGFAGRGDGETLLAIHAAFAYPDASVRVAAIHAALARRERDSVPALITLSETHWEARDRTWFEARTALLALTGEDFDSIADWKKFWDGNKDRLDPRKLDAGEGQTAVVKTRSDSESLSFFGSEIFSDNLIFVIDCSSSMQWYDPTPEMEDTLAARRERQRLPRAKTELTKSLGQIPQQSRFNIIRFDRTPRSWKKQSVPARRKSVAEGKKFAGSLNSGRGTFTGLALKEAFKDRSVDTIVLLSDGAPSESRGDILAWVRNANRSRRIRIMTFGFEGKPHNVNTGKPIDGITDDTIAAMRAFLENLAKENGGGYQPIQ